MGPIRPKSLEVWISIGLSVYTHNIEHQLVARCVLSLFLRHVSASVLGHLQSARMFLDTGSLCAYLFGRSDDECYKIIIKYVGAIVNKLKHFSTSWFKIVYICNIVARKIYNIKSVYIHTHLKWSNSLRQTHNILLCVRLHVSVLMWPSSGLLRNEVNKCWLHVGIPTMLTISTSIL